MAGKRTETMFTYWVRDAGGVTKRRFVEPIASSSGVRMDIQMSGNANRLSAGVAFETKANGYPCAVQASPGEVIVVDSDGTVAPGDMVTNDATGKATPVAATGTVTGYYVHGICQEINATDSTAHVKWEPKFVYI